MEQPTIRAGWLTLRPFGRSDVAWVFEVSTDPAVRRFVGLPSPYRLEHARAFVEDLAIAGWESGRRVEFLVEETSTGRRLARVGLGLEESGAGSIGYWVDPAARQCGVATSAVRAACRWAFTTLDLEIIQWACEVGNVASRRVAEKAGFRVEATLRRRLVHRGRRVDAWVGSVLREEMA